MLHPRKKKSSKSHTIPNHIPRRPPTAISLRCCQSAFGGVDALHINGGPISLQCCKSALGGVDALRINGGPTSAHTVNNTSHLHFLVYLQCLLRLLALLQCADQSNHGVNGVGKAITDQSRNGPTTALGTKFPHQALFNSWYTCFAASSLKPAPVLPPPSLLPNSLTFCLYCVWLLQPQRLFHTPIFSAGLPLALSAAPVPIKVNRSSREPNSSFFLNLLGCPQMESKVRMAPALRLRVCGCGGGGAAGAAGAALDDDDEDGGGLAGVCRTVWPLAVTTAVPPQSHGYGAPTRGLEHLLAKWSLLPQFKH